MGRLGARANRERARFAALADEELMGLAARADSAAFRAVFERHADAAFALAYRICGTRTAAEDVTQESFLRVWRMAARYDCARGSVRTWTLSVVRNRAIDSMRAGARRPPQQRLEDADSCKQLECSSCTEEQAIEGAEGDRLKLALEELPDAQRQAIELAYFGGFTQTEIASMLDEPLGTIKGRMRLGLHKLRDACHGWEVRP